MTPPTTRTPSQTILIAGVGNIFLGDDAFGVEVARKLMVRAWPPGVRVVDFGIRGLDLAYALLDGVGLTIVIDAMPRGDPPGTLYLMEPDTPGPAAHNAAAHMDGHSLNPVAVLQLVKTMGGEAGRLLVVGCEPEVCDERMELSATVRASLDGAIAMIEDLVRTELEG